MTMKNLLKLCQCKKSSCKLNVNEFKLLKL